MQNADKGDRPLPLLRSRGRILNGYILSNNSGSHRPLILLGLAAILVGGFSAGLSQIYPVNDDDTFHLHYIWMVKNGYVPYRDFFAHHPPGLWIAASPLFNLPATPASVIIVARVLVAVMFGISLFIVGSLTRVTPGSTALLAVLGVLIIIRCDVFLFRVEYVVSFLLSCHVIILCAMRQGVRAAIMLLIAGALLGLALTMSVRAFFFLGIPPAFIAVAARTRVRNKLLLGCCGIIGIIVGLLPCLIYLTRHDIWIDAYRYCLEFPRTIEDVRFRIPTDAETYLLAMLGMGGIPCLITDQYLSSQSKWVLGITWASAFVFQVVNPLRFDYAQIHTLLWSAPLVIVLARRVGPRVVLRRAKSKWSAPVAVIIFIGAIAAAAAAFLPMRNLHKASIQRCADMRSVYRNQLELLNVLADIGRDDSVLLIDPNHPIIVSDATYLRTAWQYRDWLEKPFVAIHLRDAGIRIREKLPAVISRNPWFRSTSGADLFAWLRRKEIINAKEEQSLREMVAEDYIAVRAKGVSLRQKGWQFAEFGDCFWVRKDRARHISPSILEILQ